MATGRKLRPSEDETVAVPGRPTAAVTTSDGQWAFASLTNDGEAAIGVLRRRRRRFGIVRTVPLDTVPDAFGMQLTHDGRFLIVAGGGATAVLRVAALQTGRGDLTAGC